MENETSCILITGNSAHLTFAVISPVMDLTCMRHYKVHISHSRQYKFMAVSIATSVQLYFVVMTSYISIAKV